MTSCPNWDAISQSKAVLQERVKSTRKFSSPIPCKSPLENYYSNTAAWMHHGQEQQRSRASCKKSGIIVHGACSGVLVMPWAQSWKKPDNRGWPCTFLVPFVAEPFLAQLGLFGKELEFRQREKDLFCRFIRTCKLRSLSRGLSAFAE